MKQNTIEKTDIKQYTIEKINVKQYDFESESMKPYIIEKTKEKPYNAMVIGISHESPYSFWHELENDLLNSNIKGKVLIDCLLHNGNNEYRFIEVDFNYLFNNQSAKHVSLDRTNYFRKLASEILSQHPDIINYSILNEFQKKLLLRNISL